MGWRDQYQQGSFRGASFRTEGHERGGGRRIASFEFPDRDEPLTEDLGRRQRTFSIDCHVIGADYITARDALLDALEAAGPGLLVHPWHGRMMVIVNQFTSTESTEEGGMCRFNIAFAEAGQPVSAPVAVPAGQATAIEADAQKATIPAVFAAGFSIDGAAGFVEDAANGLIDGMTEVSTFAAGMQGGMGPALRAFEAGLRFLPANMASLLRAPINLAHAVLGLVGAVALLGSSSRTRIAGLTRMIDWEPQTPVFPELSVSRRRQADNRMALLWLFRSSIAGELARAAASAPYASYDDAIAVRDAVSDRFDALALAAADSGDDARADVFDRLRRALVRDIAARGVTLARIYAIELPATEPALVLANRLYGADECEARAAELVERNHIAHPGFMPGGVPLQALTLTGASAAA